MRHKLDDEKKIEADCLDLAFTHNIPIVATNNASVIPTVSSVTNPAPSTIEPIIANDRTAVPINSAIYFFMRLLYHIPSATLLN